MRSTRRTAHTRGSAVELWGHAFPPTNAQTARGARGGPRTGFALATTAKPDLCIRRRAPQTNRRAMEATSEGNSQRLMGAMEMEMGTLLQDGAEEKWEAISDLDAFFSRVYDYFNERGLRCIITARIINLLTLLFTITCTAMWNTT